MQSLPVLAEAVMQWDPFMSLLKIRMSVLIGCEAAGHGVHTDKTAATMATGTVGIFHGMKSYFCQDEYGQIAPVYSISAGLDYPGVGPEHANLRISEEQNMFR